MAMVMAAFFDSGLRNVGTLSDTASTPASATAPDENARSSIKMPSDLEPSASSLASCDNVSNGISPRSCTNTRNRPTLMSSTSITM